MDKKTPYPCEVDRVMGFQLYASPYIPPGRIIVKARSMGATQIDRVTQQMMTRYLELRDIGSDFAVMRDVARRTRSIRQIHWDSTIDWMEQRMGVPPSHPWRNRRTEVSAAVRMAWDLVGGNLG